MAIRAPDGANNESYLTSIHCCLAPLISSIFKGPNYNGEIGLHVKSNFNMLHLREGKGFLICLLDSKYFAQKWAKNSFWTPPVKKLGL